MPKPRTAIVPIYDGDDFQQMADLRRAVEIAERNATAAPLRVGDDVTSEVQAAKDRFDAFVNEASTRAEEWVLEPIGHTEFYDLVADHPPRTEKDDEGKERVIDDDAPFGVNSRSFGKALLEFVDPEDPDIRTVKSPAFEYADGLSKRLKRLTAGEFDTIWMRAYQLNAGGVADPKASLYSTDSLDSSAT